MKIAIMGGWNTDSGASYHSEMIGRAFVCQGHHLEVFTFLKESFHGTNIIGEDEPYVTRCITTSNAKSPQLDPVPFLISEYDYFIVEDLGMLPKDLLGKIFHRISKKAKTISVIHDGELAKDPSFYQFDWDAVIAFDERYRNFLKKTCDENKIHMIPYPAHDMQTGDKQAARKKLGLPKEKKIVLTFGPASYAASLLIPAIAPLKNDYPLYVLGVTNQGRALEMLKAFKQSGIVDMEIRVEAPDINKLYEYLQAVDVLVVNKPNVGRVVLSSTIFQCLGSGCPIVALASDFTVMFGDAIISFTNTEELVSGIKSVFDKDKRYEVINREREKFIKENSATAVAGKFIELFKELK
ncbi:MAG: hypothetical protein ABIJ15_02445 [bacterium]